MPEPNNTSVNNLNFDDAPGGDLDLDAIFGTGTEPVSAASTDAQTIESVDNTFLKNATGTVVYKTADEAIKGIEHKDALITQLREQLATRTGADPLKQQHQENAPVNYLDDAEAYFKDIEKAKDKSELVRIQSKLIQDNLAPYAHLIGGMARSQALSKTTEEIPEFTKFVKSPEYSETLDQYPLIKNSIEIAESNPQASADLVQLYKMAYEIAASKTLSKIVQEHKQGPPVAQTRPTVSSTPVTPSTTVVAPPSLRTPEGRKSIIQQYEDKGIGDFRF